MSPVAVSADRRFHRAHVRPARKRGRLRRMLPVVKYAALAAIAVLAAYRLSVALAHAPMLRIDRIAVRGNGQMASEEVLGALAGMRGESIVWTDLDAWRSRLLALPWVREAAFRRSLPSTVEVVVSEREPIGIGRVKGQLYLVDDRGRIIDKHGPQYGELDLPIIDGLNISRDGKLAMDEERGDLAARVISSLKQKPSVARRLSQVDVSDLHNAAVIVAGDPALIYVGTDRFLQRLESYLGLAKTLRQRVVAIDYVDLRFDDRIYVRPATAAVKRIAAVPGEPRSETARTSPRKR